MHKEGYFFLEPQKHTLIRKFALFNFCRVLTSMGLCIGGIEDECTKFTSLYVMFHIAVYEFPFFLVRILLENVCIPHFLNVFSVPAD